MCVLRNQIQADRVCNVTTDVSNQLRCPDVFVESPDVSTVHITVTPAVQGVSNALKAVKYAFPLQMMAGFRFRQ